MIRPIIKLLIGDAGDPALIGGSTSSKGVLPSKTFQGLALAAVPIVLDLFGLNLSETIAVAAVNEIIVLVGLAWAAYGRVRATRPIV